MKKAITRAAIVATGVAIAGASLAIPASAATNCAAICATTVTITGSGAKYEAQINNNQTGPGVSSWIWVYGNYHQTHADYYLEGDSTMHTFYTPGDYASTNSMNLPSNVTAFRACGQNDIGGDACTNWANPAY